MLELRAWHKPMDPKALRRTIVRMAMAGGAVHLGSSFSLVEIVATLYQDYLRRNPVDRLDPRRDILALSKGHGVMALYAALYELGWLSDADIDGYFLTNNHLKGLSSALVPGIEVSGGSLGHGLPVATGLALAAKLRGLDRRIYAIVGDGELNEGSIWESFLFAAHHKLSNLVVVVDANGFQAMGQSSAVLNLESLKEKFEAFHFEVREHNGHDQEALRKSFDSFLSSKSSCPKALIARTVKGKGVSFMENDNNWHYQRLDAETFQAALRELSQ